MNVPDTTLGEMEGPRTPLWRAPPVIALFGFLALAWSLQYVVDIYAHPVIRWTVVLPYVITLFLFDNGLTEQLAYVLEAILPVPGPVLWELGNFATYYVLALVLGGAARLLNRRLPAVHLDFGD